MPRAVLQAVLGLDIAWRHAERLPAGRHVMVSNHATTGDLMVLYSLPRRCVHLVNAALPARVTQARPSAFGYFRFKGFGLGLDRQSHDALQPAVALRASGEMRRCPRVSRRSPSIFQSRRCFC